MTTEVQERVRRVASECHRITVEYHEAFEQIAAEYQEATGRRLTAQPAGELGEMQASLLMGLELAPEGKAGYDATRANGQRVQIKSRLIKDRYSKKDGSPQVGGHRMGPVDPVSEFDSVMLVLMRGPYEVYGIWEAFRPDLLDPEKFPQAELSKGLHVAHFMRTAAQVWPG